MTKVEMNDFLDSKVKDFFPKEGIWMSNCFRRELIVSESNLPCHLRNIDWMTELIIKKYGLYFLDKDAIKQYVTESEYFNKLRSEYEQEIVRWQINWMKKGGDNWIVSSRYGGEFYLFNNQCDYAFRKGIVDTLLAIGMDVNAIEEGIEKNSDMWREAFMNMAFNNEFNPIFVNFRIDFYRELNEEQNNEKLNEPDQKFKDCWLKYRRYQYYQKHKASVDQYGFPTDDMLMSADEVKELKVYLKQKSEERYLEIEEYKKRRNMNFESKQINQEDYQQFSCENYNSNEKELNSKAKKTIKTLIKKYLKK